MVENADEYVDFKKKRYYQIKHTASDKCLGIPDPNSKLLTLVDCYDPKTVGTDNIKKFTGERQFFTFDDNTNGGQLRSYISPGSCVVREQEGDKLNFRFRNCTASYTPREGKFQFRNGFFRFGDESCLNGGIPTRYSDSRMSVSSGDMCSAGWERKVFETEKPDPNWNCSGDECESGMLGMRIDNSSIYADPYTKLVNVQGFSGSKIHTDTDLIHQNKKTVTYNRPLIIQDDVLISSEHNTRGFHSELGFDPDKNAFYLQLNAAKGGKAYPMFLDSKGMSFINDHTETAALSFNPRDSVVSMIWKNGPKPDRVGLQNGAANELNIANRSGNIKFDDIEIPGKVFFNNATIDTVELEAGMYVDGDITRNGVSLKKLVELRNALQHKKLMTRVYTIGGISLSLLCCILVVVVVIISRR